MVRMASVVCAMVVVVFTGCAGPQTLGELPPDPLLVYEFGAVQGEVFLTVALDQATVRGLLDDSNKFVFPPEGEPVYASIGVTSLDVRVGDLEPYPIKIAFVWLWLDASADPKTSGEQYVQIRLWADSAAFSEALTEVGVSTELAQVNLDYQDDRWHLGISGEDFTFRGMTDVHGDAVPLKDPSPGYTTVWNEDDSIFTLYASVGHKLQPCQITIEFEGREPVLKYMFAASRDIVSCSVQTNWHARAGVYARTK